MLIVTRFEFWRHFHTTDIGYTCLEKMFQFNVWIAFLASIQITLALKDHTPPSIIIHPKAETQFGNTILVTLKCKAKGKPDTFKYEWTKNGEVIKLGSNVKVVDGDLNITSPSKNDEGSYQCFADNGFGRALSTKATLKMAYINQPPTPSNIPQDRAHVGESLKLECEREASYPDPVITWKIAKDLVDRNPEDLSLSDNMHVDSNGTLYITQVKLEDDQEGKLYVCTLYNDVLKKTVITDHNHVIVQEGTPKDRDIQLLYSSKEVHALVGKEAVFQCIFTAYPTFTITWSKVGGDLPQGRNSLKSGNTELHISNISMEDAGKYHCKGQDSDGTILEKELTLTVNGVPMFVKEQVESMMHYDSVDNETGEATFNCQSKGHPEPEVQFFINGVPAADVDSPAEISIIDGILTVHNLCNNCTNDPAIFTVQCIVTNEYGTAVAQGYVNVYYKESDQNLALIIGLVIAGILLLLIIIIILALCMKKKKKESKGQYEVPVEQSKLAEKSEAA